MSRKALQEVVCDRCGDAAMVEETDVSRKLALWGRAYAVRGDGQDVVGEADTPSDLCGSCLYELVEFMNGARLVGSEAATEAAQ